MLAYEPANAATERQPSDARHGHSSASAGEAEGLCLTVEFTPGHAPLGPGRAPSRIDAHPLHPREVDDEATITHGTAPDVVATTAYCDDEIVAASEVDCGHHVTDARTAQDQGRRLVDHAVPDSSGGVEVSVTGTE